MSTWCTQQLRDTAEAATADVVNSIARAIVTAPQLVLYDSPTAGLDPITANLIINLIIKGRDMRNTATIMVTHRFQDGHLMANFRYNPSSGKIERAESSASVRRV